MAITKSAKTAAKKTKKAVIDPAVRGTKKLVKSAANSLKGGSKKSASRSKKTTARKKG